MKKTGWIKLTRIHRLALQAPQNQLFGASGLGFEKSDKNRDTKIGNGAHIVMAVGNQLMQGAPRQTTRGQMIIDFGNTKGYGRNRFLPHFSWRQAALFGSPQIGPQIFDPLRRGTERQRRAGGR